MHSKFENGLYRWFDEDTIRISVNASWSPADPPNISAFMNIHNVSVDMVDNLTVETGYRLGLRDRDPSDYFRPKQGVCLSELSYPGETTEEARRGKHQIVKINGVFVPETVCADVLLVYYTNQSAAETRVISHSIPYWNPVYGDYLGSYFICDMKICDMKICPVFL